MAGQPIAVTATPATVTEAVTMTDLERRAQTAIVNLPREIDLANAADVFALLISAIASDTEVLVADMTSTGFCDSSGIREIMHVRGYAVNAGVEFRVVVPPGGVLRGPASPGP